MDGLNISSEISRLMRSIEASNPDMVTSARISAAWHKAMDEQVLAHTDAVYSIPGSNGSDVIIYVDTAIWAADLGLQAELLRLRLNVALNELDEAKNARPPSHEGALFDVESREQVKRLRFIVSKEKYRTREVARSTAEQIEEQAPPRIEPKPLTPEEDQALWAQASAIEDEKLREAAYRAAKAGLELAKGEEA